MIKRFKDGSIYICIRNDTNKIFHKFDGEIQIDTDCLGRDRFVGYTKNSFAPTIDSHRINLSKNPGEVFEQSNYYSFWLPLDEEKVSFGDVTIIDAGIGSCRCSKCKHMIDPGDNYCKHCGSKIIARRLIGGIYGSDGKWIE